MRSQSSRSPDALLSGRDGVVSRHLPYISELVGFASHSLPVVSQLGGIVREHIPSASQHFRNDREHFPIALQHIPVVSQHIPNVLQHIPNVLQHVRNDREQLPYASEHVGVVSQLKRCDLQRFCWISRSIGRAGRLREPSNNDLATIPKARLPCLHLRVSATPQRSTPSAPSLTHRPRLENT